MELKIQNLIIECIKELNEELENDALRNPTRNTRLYGLNGVLDSLTLVTLITDLEEKIFDEFGNDVTLADEKAMSQRHSPFRSVQSLTNYIVKLLEEETNE
jgi:acyl carrier protein